MGLKLFVPVPLTGSFWIRVVFPSVIHSVFSVFCMHLFISVASLSWMKVNFLNQNPYMPSTPEVFQFGLFLGVAFCASRYITILGPSSIHNSGSMLFIHLAFYELLLVYLHPLS